MRSSARDTRRGRIGRSLVLKKRGRLAEASVTAAGPVAQPPSPPPPPPLLDVHARLRGSILSPSDAGTSQNGPLGLEPRGVECVGGHYSPAAQALSLDPSRGVITWRRGERMFGCQGGGRDGGMEGLIALSEISVPAGNLFGRRGNGRDWAGGDGAHTVPKTPRKVEEAVGLIVGEKESSIAPVKGDTQSQKMSELRGVEHIRTSKKERGEYNNASEAVTNLGVLPLSTVGSSQSRQITWAADEASVSATRPPPSPPVPGRGGQCPNMTSARRLRSSPPFGQEVSSLSNDHRADDHRADGSRWGDATPSSWHEDTVETGFRRYAEMSRRLMNLFAVSRRLRRSNVYPHLLRPHLLNTTESQHGPTLPNPGHVLVG